MLVYDMNFSVNIEKISNSHEIIFIKSAINRIEMNYSFAKNIKSYS